MRGVVTLVALAACGRIGFGQLGGEDTGVPLDGIFDANNDANTGMATCNQMSRIADDFEDGVRDVERWGNSYKNPGTSFAEQNGELVITPATNTTNAYAAYVSLRYYDVREQRMSAQVTQVAAGQSSTGISLDFSEGNYIHLTQKGGFLLAAQRLGGIYTQVNKIPYDGSSHKYWAMSERSGRVYWETSVDGATWTSFADIAAPFDVSLVRPGLFAGTDSGVAAPGSAHYASFNTGVASGSPACAAHVLVDPFTSDGIGHGWENKFADPCCTVAVTGGVVSLHTTGAIGYSGLRSSAGYVLKEDAVSIAIPGGPSAQSTFYGVLSVRADVNNSAELSIRDAVFVIHLTIAGVDSAQMVSRGPTQNYVRIRETAGTLYLEASSDRLMWTQLYAQATPFSVDDVVIGVEGGIFGSAGSAADLSFDDYNTP